MTLTIAELYPSILGESTHAGRPCVLVRLTGCNLRCSYCDSAFAFHGGTERTLEELLAEVRATGLRWVLITGGEPLLQSGIIAFIDQLVDEGFSVLVETSGALDIGPVNPKAITILDIKCPGSGETEKMHWANLTKLRPRDEVKFVISDRRDYEWSRQIISEQSLGKKNAVLFSPVHGVITPRDLAQWMLEDRSPAHLQLQIHKYIWEPGKRGV